MNPLFFVRARRLTYRLGGVVLRNLNDEVPQRKGKEMAAEEEEEDPKIQKIPEVYLLNFNGYLMPF